MIDIRKAVHPVTHQPARTDGVTEWVRVRKPEIAALITDDPRGGTLK